MAISNIMTKKEIWEQYKLYVFLNKKLYKHKKNFLSKVSHKIQA